MLQIFKRVTSDMQYQAPVYPQQIQQPYYNNYYPQYETNEVEMPDEPLVDLDFFMDGKANLPASQPVAGAQDTTVTEVAKKKKTRKKKLDNGQEIITPASAFAGDSASNTGDLTMPQSNVPYLSTYADSCGQLDGVINEINVISAGIDMDINTVRNSKTIKNKYNYLSNLIGARGGLISSKIQAIREKNSCIKDSNSLDLKRMEAINKIGLNNQQDDNKILTDLYTAYTQMSTGMAAMGQNPFGYPSSIDATVAGSGIVRSSLNAQPLNDGYNTFLQAPNASQAAVQASMNPNIKTVVMYDPMAPKHQQVWFDVIDTTTGQPVPNVERPHPSLLENIEIQQDAGIAVDSFMQRTYPLIVKGNPMINQY